MAGDGGCCYCCGGAVSGSEARFALFVEDEAEDGDDDEEEDDADYYGDDVADCEPSGGCLIGRRGHVWAEFILFYFSLLFFEIAGFDSRGGRSVNREFFAWLRRPNRDGFSSGNADCARKREKKRNFPPSQKRRVRTRIYDGGDWKIARSIIPPLQ